MAAARPSYDLDQANIQTKTGHQTVLIIEFLLPLLIIIMKVKYLKSCTLPRLTSLVAGTLSRPGLRSTMQAL